MNTDIILKILRNSGFNILGTDSVFIYLEDPSCILRSFETFIKYAWVIISFITAMLLFGWAISMIRGAKNDIFTNLRNLILIFGTLSAAIPIVNAIYGKDLFATGCRTIKVPITEVNQLLDARNRDLGNQNINPAPTNKPHTLSYSENPISSAGNPANPSSVTVAPNTNTIIP